MVPLGKRKHLPRTIIFSALHRNFQLGFTYQYVQDSIEIESDPLFSNFHGQ